MNDTNTQTHPKYIEEWIVLVGKDSHILDINQIKILKEKMASGDRGFIDFGDFGFAVSHVSSFHLHSRRIKNQLAAPDKYPELSLEQRQKARMKIGEIRKKMAVKNVI
jgi:hypothetical protein